MDWPSRACGGIRLNLSGLVPQEGVYVRMQSAGVQIEKHTHIHTQA